LSEPNIIVRVFEGNDFWVKKNRQMAGLFGKDLCYTEVRKSSPPKNLEFCSQQGSKKRNGDARAEIAQGRCVAD
jgi:hypothetical protein